MASLPFFHCFGCTVTLWHPLIKGVRIVTYPTPVDALKNAELIEKYQVTLLPTTPTFLRAYLKRSEPKQFASVKIGGYRCGEASRANWRNPSNRSLDFRYWKATA